MFPRGRAATRGFSTSRHTCRTATELHALHPPPHFTPPPALRNADELHRLEERSFAEWQAGIQQKQRSGMDVSFYEPRLEVRGRGAKGKLV